MPLISHFQSKTEDSSSHSSYTTTMQGYGNSSVLDNTTGEGLVTTEKALRLYNAARLIVIITGPILLIAGVVCNTIALVILQKRKLNLNFSSYLSALAVCDSAFLICSVTTWVTYTMTGQNLAVKISCNLVYFLNYFPADLSAFILVALSLDRVLKIYLPTRKAVLNRLFRPKFVILGLVVLSMLANWHTLGGLKVDEGNNTVFSSCVGKTTGVNTYNQLHLYILDNIFYSVAPSLLIICFNTMIVMKVLSHSRVIQSRRSPDSIYVQASEHRRRREDYVTKAALTVTFTFVLFTTPVGIVFMLEPQADDLESYAMWFLVLQIAGIFMHLNHCVNMMLYCLIGPQFRAQFCRLFRRPRRVAPDQGVHVIVMPAVRSQVEQHFKAMTHHPTQLNC